MKRTEEHMALCLVLCPPLKHEWLSSLEPPGRDSSTPFVLLSQTTFTEIPNLFNTNTNMSCFTEQVYNSRK